MLYTITRYRDTTNTRESAVIIAMSFQKAVERGEVKNTDEAYISFANQYIA